MALTTVSAYKTYAGISGIGEDTRLAVYLAAASASIRYICGRSLSNGFESASRTEVIDGQGTGTLQLKEWPVSSITSVSEIDNSGSSTALASTEYRVDSNTGILYKIGAEGGRFGYSLGLPTPYTPQFGTYPAFPKGIQNISVVYTGGYSSIPSNLEMAVFRVMDLLRASAGADPTKQSESLGAYTYTARSAADTDLIVQALVGDFKTGGL